MSENTDKYMKNALGHMVPVDLVKPIEQERDALVRRLEERYAQVRTVCKQFRMWADEEIEAYLQLSQEQYGISRGG